MFCRSGREFSNESFITKSGVDAAETERSLKFVCGTPIAYRPLSLSLPSCFLRGAFSARLQVPLSFSLPLSLLVFCEALSFMTLGMLRRECINWRSGCRSLFEESQKYPRATCFQLRMENPMSARSLRGWTFLDCISTVSSVSKKNEAFRIPIILKCSTKH